MKNIKLNKALLLVAGILIALFFAGCSGADDKAEEEKKVSLDDNYYTPGEILKDIEEGKTFAFAIVDKECSACQVFKENALSEFEKENPGTIKMIEVNGIQDNPENMEDIVTLIDEHLLGSFSATPTTYLIKDGLLLDTVVGAIEYEELKDFYNTLEEETEEKAEDAEKSEEKAEAEEEAEANSDETEDTDKSGE